MSSSASPAMWLKAALAQHVAAAPVRAGGRHRAPEAPRTAQYLTSEQIAAGAGRHAEPEWSREAFDPARDEVDAFDWLGFEAAQD